MRIDPFQSRRTRTPVLRSAAVRELSAILAHSWPVTIDEATVRLVRSLALPRFGDATAAALGEQQLEQR